MHLQRYSEMKFKKLSSLIFKYLNIWLDSFSIKSKSVENERLFSKMNFIKRTINCLSPSLYHRITISMIEIDYTEYDLISAIKICSSAKESRGKLRRDAIKHLVKLSSDFKF